MLMLPPLLYFISPKAAVTLLCIDLALVLQPIGPWPRFRTYFQLFYEIFNFHHNLSPETVQILTEKNHLSMITMHPHGIIPLQGFIGFSFCDQHIPALSGVGATTDFALLLPILRQILGYLSVGSAKKGAILHAMQNENKNMLISPGGVAEIFLCHRRSGKDEGGQVQSIKARRYGLMKLAFQTGTAVYPVYIFGATDLFDQLMPEKKANVENKGHNQKLLSIVDYVSKMVESASRRFQGGISIFWGQYFLPIPHNPQLSLVMADPIYPVPGTSELNTSGGKTIRTCKRVKDPTPEQVEELVGRYVDSMQRLFEQYKVEAGYPNDTLQIL
jgi:hypothetical protein